MVLSYRLNKIASFVDDDARLADVGTDHGFIPIKLIQDGRITQAIAMDIGQGPLQRAVDHITEYHLQEQIECRLSDGVAKLQPEEVDCIVIAGMGGALIEKILDAANPEFFQDTKFVLQPQSEYFKVRHCIHEHGMRIEQEDFFLDEGKYYVVMKAVPGNEGYSKNVEYVYGKYLLEHKNEVLFEYLKKQLHKLEKIADNIKAGNGDNIESYNEQTKNRLVKMCEERQLIETALAYYEN